MHKRIHIVFETSDRQASRLVKTRMMIRRSKAEWSKGSRDGRRGHLWARALLDGRQVRVTAGLGGSLPLIYLTPDFSLELYIEF